MPEHFARRELDAPDAVVAAARDHLALEDARARLGVVGRLQNPEKLRRFLPLALPDGLEIEADEPAVLVLVIAFTAHEIARRGGRALLGRFGPDGGRGEDRSERRIELALARPLPRDRARVGVDGDDRARRAEGRAEVVGRAEVEAIAHDGGRRVDRGAAPERIARELPEDARWPLKPLRPCHRARSSRPATEGGPGRSRFLGGRGLARKRRSPDEEPDHAREDRGEGLVRPEIREEELVGPRLEEGDHPGREREEDLRQDDDERLDRPHRRGDHRLRGARRKKHRKDERRAGPTPRPSLHGTVR